MGSIYPLNHTYERIEVTSNLHLARTYDFFLYTRKPVFQYLGAT